MLTCSNCSSVLTWPYFSCTICTNPYLYLCIKCYKVRNTDASFLNSSSASYDCSSQSEVAILHSETHDFIKVSSKFEEDNLDFSDVSEGSEDSSQSMSEDENDDHRELLELPTSSKIFNRSASEFPLPNSSTNSRDSLINTLGTVTGDRDLSKERATYLTARTGPGSGPGPFSSQTSQNRVDRGHDHGHPYAPEPDQNSLTAVAPSAPKKLIKIAKNLSNSSTNFKRKPVKISFGTKDTPNFISSDLRPLDEEIQFLNFIGKKGLASVELTDQFLEFYPSASCKRTSFNLKRAAERDSLLDESEPVWGSKRSKSGREGAISTDQRMPFLKFSESISYPIPEYILDKEEEMTKRWSSALLDVGYLTRTGDFNTADALNDAEEHIAAINMSSMVPDHRNRLTEEEIALRDLMIESFIIYQRERQRQKDIIKDHGLTGLKLTEKDFSPISEDDKIYNSFASICSKEELEKFRAGLRYEYDLREKIKRLEKLKAYGVKTKTDQLLFEKLDVERKVDIAQRVTWVDAKR